VETIFDGLDFDLSIRRAAADFVSHAPPRALACMRPALRTEVARRRGPIWFR
jgi:hypothetical protein